MKKDIHLDFEELSHEDELRPSFTRGTPPPAGIFLVDGRYHVAFHHTRSERRLLEAGALLIASVVFDGARWDRPPVAPGASAGQDVRPVAAGAMVGEGGRLASTRN